MSPLFHTCMLFPARQFRTSLLSPAKRPLAINTTFPGGCVASVDPAVTIWGSSHFGVQSLLFVESPFLGPPPAMALPAVGDLGHQQATFPGLLSWPSLCSFFCCQSRMSGTQPAPG